MKVENYTQENIDQLWATAWSKQSKVAASQLFKHPLFVEGYSRYRRYLPTPPFSLLEIGAGSGRYGLAIARDNPNCTVLLTDPLDESVKAMEYSAKDLSLNNVSLRTADMRELPFSSLSFDVVFADAVVQHIIDVDQAINEAIRVLKPGGRLIISNVNSHNPFHTLYKKVRSMFGFAYEYGYERTLNPRELKEMLRRPEMEEVEVDGFYLAYGIYRWGYRYPIFKLISRVVNRLVKVLDRLSTRWFSRRLGFMLIAVGTKKPVS